MSHFALCNFSVRDKRGSERICSAQDTLSAVTSPFHMYKWGRWQEKSSLTALGTSEDISGLESTKDMVGGATMDPTCTVRST